MESRLTWRLIGAMTPSYPTLRREPLVPDFQKLILRPADSLPGPYWLRDHVADCSIVFEKFVRESRSGPPQQQLSRYVRVWP